jgi:hypothetical protein
MIWKAYKDDRNCFANHFTPSYGKINPDMIWRDVAPRSETGDSQIIVMDYANNHIYAMYPSPVLMTPGWTRPAVRIDLNPRFQEKWNM